MRIEQKIAALDQLAVLLRDPKNEIWQTTCIKAQQHNPWFTPQSIQLAVEGICKNYLDASKLEAWLEAYSIQPSNERKRVALILAGNIPLVGIHDIICVFLSNNIALIKLSSKDEHLIKAFVKLLISIDDDAGSYFEFTERLDEFDAVIATGSNNSARYFNAYFGKYPHIIRKNRNAVAILSKDTNDEDIIKLGSDIFTYFGLGCRSVSKLYLEESFKLTRIFDVWDARFNELINHNKFKNNFEYNYSIYLLNKEEFYTNNVIVFKPDVSIPSRIASVNYEYFKDLNSLNQELEKSRDLIQCIVTDIDLKGFDAVPFGDSQNPSLSDYADGVDTMYFLVNLK